MKNWLPLFAFVVAGSCLSAESYLTKKFLFTTSKRLSAKPKDPLKIYSFYRPHQKEFLQQTHKYDYSDIFAPTRESTEGIYAYNMLYQRTDTIKFHDKIHGLRKECYRVYTKDGKRFKRRKLRSMFNMYPRGYNKRNSWYFSYCAGEDLYGDKDTLLYFFHGASGNPFNFIDRRAIAEVREEWRRLGSMPKWVSISMGRVTSLAQKGVEDRFMKVVVPYVEKRLGFKGHKKPKNRIALGVSLGGGNVTHLLMKQKKFLKAAFLVCPAVSFLDKHTSDGTYKNFLTNSGAYRSVVGVAMRLVPKEFGNHKYFRTVDPFLFGQTSIDKNTPPFYIQSSSMDEFGFHVGGRIFAMMARTLGASVGYEELKGRHCVVDPKVIVSFFREHIQQDIRMF